MLCGIFFGNTIGTLRTWANHECPLCAHQRPFDTQHKMMRIAIPRRLYVVLWERLAGWRHVTRRNI
jgi:hypothetical protein